MRSGTFGNWRVLVLIFIGIGLVSFPVSVIGQEGPGLGGPPPDGPDEGDQPPPFPNELEWPDIPLREVLRELADYLVINLSLPSDPKMNQLVNERFTGLSADTILDELLRKYGFVRQERQPGFYVVITQSSAETLRLQQQLQTGPLPQAAQAAPVMAAKAFIITEGEFENAKRIIETLQGDNGVLHEFPDKNTLIVQDEEQFLNNIQGILDTMDMIDQGTFVQGVKIDKGLEHKVYEIQNLKASDLKKSIEELLSGRGKVIPNDALNTLFIVDREDVLKKIDAFIEAIDKEEPQVLIEAKLIEVELTDQDLAGVNLNFQDVKGSGTGIETASSLLLIPGFTNVIGDGNNPFSFALSKTIDPLSIQVQLIAKQRSVNLLSSPSVMTANNIEATFTLIERIPYVNTRVDSAAGAVGDNQVTTTTEVEFEDVETSLRVRPEIRPNGMIRMEIRPKVSKFKERFQGVPVIDTREIITTVSVRDRQTLVLGGLIREESTQMETRVPFLGSIPLLGWLFRSVEERKTKIELILLIRPQIIKDQTYKDLVWESKLRNSDQRSFFFETVSERPSRMTVEPSPIVFPGKENTLDIMGVAKGDAIRILDPQLQAGGQGLRAVFHRRSKKGDLALKAAEGGIYAFVVQGDSRGIRIQGMLNQVQLKISRKSVTLPKGSSGSYIPIRELVYGPSWDVFAPYATLPIRLPADSDLTVENLRVTMEVPGARLALEGLPIIEVTKASRKFKGQRWIHYMFPGVDDAAILEGFDTRISIERIVRDEEAGTVRLEPLEQQRIKVKKNEEVGFHWEPGRLNPGVNPRYNPRYNPLDRGTGWLLALENGKGRSL